MLTYVAQYYFIGNQISEPIGSGHMSVVPYRAYEVKDGYIVIAVFVEKFWQILCNVIGEPQLGADERYNSTAQRLKNREQVDKLCEEAIEYGFYSVCVNTTWTAYCARKLRGKGVKVCTVVGFPLGAMDSRAKSFETRNAVENGADEIDMVMNVGALKSGDLKAVEEDIRWVLRACRQNTILKVIIENALLTDEEKVLACQIAKRAGAHYVKTSTGFASSGATVEDIALMRRTVGLEMGVKAAGGVRSYEDAVAMIQAGASRIGASSSVAIVTGAKSR